MKKVIKFLFILVFFILLIGGFSKVFGAEEIDIKITPNNKNLTTSDVMLIIDISSTKIFDSTYTQAVQLIIGEESLSNKWVDLGSGKNGVALRKSYNYIIKNNGKVSVRVVEWSKEDKSDLKELTIQTYEVSNIDKTNPIIEKIEYNATSNSISLNILAKDADSGIAKYTCVCDSISLNKTSENSKFDITGLQENKEYIFVITVEDKIGNKISDTKTIKTITTAQLTANQIQNQTTNNTNVQNIAEIQEPVATRDNTIANKKIPAVGKSNLIFVMLLVIISFIIIKNKR